MVYSYRAKYRQGTHDYFIYTSHICPNLEIRMQTVVYSIWSAAHINCVLGMHNDKKLVWQRVQAF